MLRISLSWFTMQATVPLVVLAVVGFTGPFVHAIVGGFDTTIENFPYQVAVEISGTQRCGGSIISDQWILTSATCIRRLQDTTTLGVRVGSTRRQDGGEVYAVSAMRMHPEFNRTTHHADVALLNLRDRITFSSTARAVTLASDGQVLKMGKKLVVTGWGAVSKYDTSDFAEVLQAARIPFVDNHVCNLVFDGAVTSAMLCAGVGGKDSCTHDAGDPLVDDDRVQFGLVSWGFSGCDTVGFPGVYTNLAEHSIRGWIKNSTSV